MLDSFEFKKARPVTITGQASSAEQINKFEKDLLTKKGVAEVKVLNTAPDKKSKKIKFTISFHYKNFTKKKGRAPMRWGRLEKL